MFDSGIGGLSSAATVDAVEACHRALVEVECRQLTLAAHWADLHPGEPLEADARRNRRPGMERGLRLGGEGTPLVAGFAPAELGPLLGTTTGAADRLIGDALDLRHRLPRLWSRVVAAEVRAWQARHVAQATRHLDPAAAAAVDDRIAAVVGHLAWARVETLLEAAILTADPDGAAARARQAEAERFVRAGRTSEHGLKLLIARAAAGDVIWFTAMVDRLAAILRLDGDLDPVDVRRSKAIGILAQPAYALQLLIDHQAAPDTGPAEPDDSEAEAAVAAERDDHRSIDLTPPPIDPDKLRNRAVVYVHLNADTLAAGFGVARVEDTGPVLLGQLQMLLGGHTRISLRPVIDLNRDPMPVDAYEVPDRLRDLIHLRQPGDAFPYGTNLSRALDLDHTVPYLVRNNARDGGGPTGQTRLGNLAPLTRRHHRVKTFGRWRTRQPSPGTVLWRSPHHRIYLVNATGTHPLGTGAWAEAAWRAAETPIVAARPRAPDLVPT